MGFKKLIGHFYVAMACRGLARPGTLLQALHCSSSLGAPSPSAGRACTGLARERESVGGAQLWLPRAAGAGGSGAAWGQSQAGDDRSPRCRPGISPQARSDASERWRSSVDLPCHPWLTAADLSLLLKGSPLVHTFRVGSSPCSLPPQAPNTPLVTGYLVVFIARDDMYVYNWQEWLWVAGWEKPRGCVG